MSGVQLNVRWPDVAQIERYKSEVPDTHRIILQVGRRAMQDRSPREIATVIDSYSGIITDVLIDPSGGEGVVVEPAEYEVLLDEITRLSSNPGVGFAGGLSKDSGRLLEDLYRRYLNINIDVEGRLRDADDDLDVVAASNYVEVAIAALRKSRQPQEG